MLIGVPRESRPGETRVAATPATAAALLRLGHEVLVESGAGAAASAPDDAYAAAGARVGSADDAWSADVVLHVGLPTEEEARRLGPGQVFVGSLQPALNPALLDVFVRRGVTALAVDAVPRISRAQSMDVLSSMANLAGYRAVIEAAHAFGRTFTGQVTAAGKVPPARVLVVGAGVAGLAAVGAASSLGAVVRATDVRPEVAEQVASLGGEFVPVTRAAMDSADGYAREVSADDAAFAAGVYAREVREVDIVITTALIPGRPAPRLVDEAMVATMKPGSVVVDMAAAMGGNVAGTVADRVVTTPNGVTLVGYTDLPARLPAQASQLFGTNLANLLALLTPAKDGQLVVDLDDVVVRGVTVARDGALLWPPPPVSVSAAPPPAPAAAPAAVQPTEPARTPAQRARRRAVLVGVGAVLLFVLAAVAPDPLPRHVTVFALAIVIGFYVIGNVHHALHTPLMSVTNAISGIILVGALLQLGSSSGLVTALAFVAVLVASINVFGGFAVTRRMLGMFTRG